MCWLHTNHFYQPGMLQRNAHNLVFSKKSWRQDVGGPLQMEQTIVYTEGKDIGNPGTLKVAAVTQWMGWMNESLLFPTCVSNTKLLKTNRENVTEIINTDS